MKNFDKELFDKELSSVKVKNIYKSDISRFLLCRSIILTIQGDPEVNV